MSMIAKPYITLILGILLLGALSCEVDIPPDTDFSGTWTCTEQSSLYGQQSFQVQITNDIIIQGQTYVGNFYNLGFSEEATMLISGSNVTIPFQTLSGHDITGDGDVVTVNRIELDYIISDGIDADTVQSVLVR